MLIQSVHLKPHDNMQYCRWGRIKLLESRAVAEAGAGFLLVNLRCNEDENCVTWKINGVVTSGSRPKRLVEDFRTYHGAVGRIEMGEDIPVGMIVHPMLNKISSHFVVEGKEHRENTDYNLLTVTPNCSLGYRTGPGTTFLIKS